ncbi:hypothetical protein K435DRAFT_854530 [Dendrothele bispora CBS 962.96]|uniref:Uncharacterized protein n=1 Tax=Dendrothele bispora (strain CBS 962.96) TaxID=1314807 RepID=A0A4S8MDY0_DENBC|nr:hypothetical protein K435DRAFT_854530 [Dendrothele bispora CBS 962.96]
MPSMTFAPFATKQASTPSVETTPDHVESSATSPVDSAPATDKEPSPNNDDTEPQSLSQTFFPSLASLRDQRAYEHERQRSKKAADLAKAKARKGQWSLLTYDSKRSLSSSPTRNPEKSKRLRPEEMEALERTPRAMSSEVKLADLISSKSVRKPRVRKGKDSDYEVVPHVRSVIVLDDIMARDVSFDEPWEHVEHSDSDDSSSDSVARKEQTKKTYADILSTAK